MNKKEYIILFSSLVFLVAVVAVGVLFFYPNTDEETEAEEGIEYIRDTAPQGDEEPVVLIEQLSSPELRQRFLDASSPEAAQRREDLSAQDSMESSVEELDVRTTRIDVPPDTTIKDDDLDAADTTQNDVSEPQTQKNIAVVPRASSEQKPSQSDAVISQKRTTSTAVTRQALDESSYWIQLFATEDRFRAEELREQLRDVHLHALLRLYVEEGRRFYRLRVGAFTNEQEAEKFMGWILAAENFSEAYVIRTSN